MKYDYWLEHYLSFIKFLFPLDQWGLRIVSDICRYLFQFLNVKMKYIQVLSISRRSTHMYSADLPYLQSVWAVTGSEWFISSFEYYPGERPCNVPSWDVIDCSCLSVEWPDRTEPSLWSNNNVINVPSLTSNWVMDNWTIKIMLICQIWFIRFWQSGTFWQSGSSWQLWM